MLLLWVYFIGAVIALDNGLARTPPMGWMSWTAFYCEMDCVKHPKACINENLYMEMADELVKGGYREAGYVNVHVDDCWMGREREKSSGRLIANTTRFPSGIQNLSRYMHARGLNFGIYEDYGTKTCAGFPGSYGYLKIDAETFAEWEVDYLKLDGCNIDTDLMPKGYADMELALNATGRPIVYSCSWPAYLIDRPEKVDYNTIAKSCNLWRNFDDINSSWKSILSIIDYYDHNQNKHIPTHGPGQWHDPDMLVIGNPGITVNMAIAQMTIWSIWSAPLIMSNDLRIIAPEFRKILLNREVIAIDQDPMGRMGRLVANVSGVGAYVKPITPLYDTDTSFALGFLNRNTKPNEVEFKLRNMGLENPRGYMVKDLWNDMPTMKLFPDNILRIVVPPTSAALYRAELIRPKRWVEKNQMYEMLTNKVPTGF
ncbi:alpha-galactosidase [Necator americanus]|uniref:Alpha-galactosidase n=1 Tax=Necator americanus TaxID=51031 RepID=W2T7R4_NECAM|nr:alpha-galactosidase [Necator americanus]ETN78060.1 alpha-galactosidase [Necator americanus]